MKTGMHPPRHRGAVVAFGVLAALLLVVSPVEARFKIKIRSTPKSPSAPSVSKPHVPSPTPEAPKALSKVDAGRSASAPQVSVAPQSRGFFDRILDWVLWRRPAPAPVAPAPVAPAPAAPPPVVAAAPAPPATAPVVVPVALPAAAPSTLGAQGSGPGQEKERQANTPPAWQTRHAPVIKGYILHLTNGGRVSVAHYQEKGDEIVIPQRSGTFGLSKSMIARIEEVKEEPDPGIVVGGRR